VDFNPLSRSMTMEPILITIIYFAAPILLGVAVGILIYSIVGFVVAVFAYYTQPPRDPSTGACGTCSDLQALWDSMNTFEKIASYLNFAVAKWICDSQSCPLNLD